MKIDRLTLVNFGGIKGRLEIDLPQIAAIIGPNGIGKTTILNGLRFALTGAEPDGEIIHKGTSQCSASIQITDPSDGVVYEFERRKIEGKPSKNLIDGKATTKKAMDEKIESIIGIPIDKVKILSSSDVVAAMKPDEFSSFILDYIPEKVKIEDIIGLVPDSTIGMMRIMSANLPTEGIDLAALDEFDEMCRFNRKDVKSQLQKIQALYETKPHEDPGYDKKELDADLKRLQGIDAEQRIYLARKDAYDRAVASAKKHTELLASLKKQYEGMTIQRPDPAVVTKYESDLRDARSSIQNQQTAIRNTQTALRQLEITLAALEKPICPISPLITCHENKSVAKAEISESITSTKEGIQAMQEELDKAEKRAADCENRLKEEREKIRLYDQKVAIARQIKGLEDTKPALPEKPEEIPVVDIRTERQILQQKLDTLNAYEEGLRLLKKIEDLKEEAADYEALVKAVADKGPVRVGIVSSYLGVFEELCNERAHKTRPDVNFTFVSEGGVKPLMDTGNGALPYASLSGGEKAFMMFILMDMLSALTGTKLLLLDELSVIDTKCFEYLLDTVLAYKEDYDHVILCAVDHTDTVTSINSKSVPTLSITDVNRELIAA